MIANNIFKAIGDFFRNVLFAPYDALRSMDNWWVQSTISWIFIAIASFAFFYTLSQLRKFQNTENE